MKAPSDYFPIIARKYDRMNTILSFGIHHFWKKKAVRISGIKPGDKVIDVCGGTGDLSILAANFVGPNGRVILFDKIREMIDAGKSKVCRKGNSNIIDYVQADAEEIPFREGEFDAVLIGFGLRNLNHIEKGIEESYRVLRQGGKFLSLEFSRPISPVIRWIYNIYCLYFIPLAGQLIGGSREAYTYLPESIMKFPLPEEIKVLLQKTGFVNVTYKRLSNGIVVIHKAIKK